MIKDENGGRGFDRCRREEYRPMADVPDRGASVTPKPDPSATGSNILPAYYDGTVNNMYSQSQSQPHPTLTPITAPIPIFPIQTPTTTPTTAGPPQPSRASQAPCSASASGPAPPQPVLTPQPQARVVKRPRPVKSCTECRKRKLKCDRNQPCTACDKARRPCKYAADHDSANLSDSDGEMSERPLKRSCPPPSHHEMVTRAPEPAPPAAPSVGTPATLPPTLAPPPLPASAQAVEELNRRIESLEKMITGLTRSPSTTGSSSVRGHHRLGPVQTPLWQLLIKTPKNAIPGRPKGLRTRFLGANCTRVLLSLFPDAKDFMMSQNKTDEVKELFSSLSGMHKAFSEYHRSQMIPKQVYVDSMTPILRRMSDILPPKADCDRLFETYVMTSETLYRIVHVPSFREDYRAFWNNEQRPDSFLPLLLTMMALATKFESRSMGPGQGINIPTACTLVRMWLDGLKGKFLVDMATLQVEVLLNHTQRMLLKPQESWSRLGFIVRMAMSMGMHRDPSEFPDDIPAFEGELRRRLWWSILDMDLHMSLQCSLPCAIRDDDFTCKPPLNLNDEDLYPEMDSLPEERPHDQYTTCQLQVHASKTLPHRLKVVNLINRVGTADENEILEAGAKLERMIEDVELNFPRPPVINDRESATRWRTRVALDLHCRRPLLALYRPFALGPPSMEPPPPQLSRSYQRSSMALLTYLEELDPASPVFPEIQHQWYLLLRQDILQAVFSVCFYIKNEVLRQQQLLNPVAMFPDNSSPLVRHSSLHSLPANGAGPRPGPGQWAGAGTAGWPAVTTPESSSAVDDGLGIGASANTRGMPSSGYFESQTLYSLKRMEETVARTLDVLVSRILEIGSDLKDFVSISVVLSTSRLVVSTSGHKLEDTIRGIRKIMNTCIDIKKSIPSQQPVSLLSAPTQVTMPPHTIHPHPTPSPASSAFTVPPQGYPFNPNFPVMPHGMDSWDQEFWGWTLPHQQQQQPVNLVPQMPPLPPSMPHVPMTGAP